MLLQEKSARVREVAISVVMRTIEATHALLHLSLAELICSLSMQPQGQNLTYKLPSKKIPVRPTFLFFSICKFQIMGMGMHRMTTSINMFDIPFPREKALALMQWFAS